MKGMRKISRGADFDGAVRYVLSGDDEKRPEPGRLLGGSFGVNEKPVSIIRQFDHIASMKKSIKKAVWHNSLRLPKGETVDEERWVEIGDAYMQKMGFTEAHPRIYVLHDDYDGQHIHIIASRVGIDGSVFYGQNENLISTRVIAQLEKEFALTITKGVDLDQDGHMVMPDVKPLRKGEIEKAVRTGEKPTRMILQEAVETALAGKPTTTRFMEKLEAVGITVSTTFAGEKFSGFSFGCNGVHFSASDLGDTYKFSRLKRRLNHDEIRDHPELAKRRTQRGNNARDPERSNGSTAKNGRGPSPGDKTDSQGDGAAGAGDSNDGEADRADRAPAETARGSPDIREAARAVERISKPARERWRLIYAERKAKKEAAKKLAEQEAYDQELRDIYERERRRRLKADIEARIRPARMICADDDAWRSKRINPKRARWLAMREEVLFRQYGHSSSHLVTMFRVSYSPPRQEIVFENAAARVVDKGPLITAREGNQFEIEAMLNLARLKEWKSIQFHGTQEFKAAAMKRALDAGFRVAFDNAQDERLLRSILEERVLKRDATRIITPAPHPRRSQVP